MSTPLSPDLSAFGARYKPATVQPGQAYWRLIRAEGPLERGGNANIYVDVQNEQGQRLTGIPVLFYWSEGNHVSATELKPGEPDQGTNMPMSAGGNAYGVRIKDALPSDDIFGLGLVPFQSHKSYRLVFRRTIASVEGGPTPVPMPDKLRLVLQQARSSIDLALELLDKEGR